MARKRKKNIILNKLKLSGVGSLGKGFVKTDDKKIVFTKYGVPGDVVDINIKKKRSSYLEGDIIKFHKQSKLRAEPKCSHFKLCGGCNWQNISYDYQLKYKSDQVLQNLMRIGKIQIDKIFPIIKSDKQYYYRNKMEYSFSNSRWITDKEIKSQKEIKNKNALGFHKSGMWSKIIDINKCYLQENISNNDELGFDLESKAPLRTYTNNELIKLSSASATIKCECPQHLSSMILKLIQFEIYSTECANRFKKDADLHVLLGNLTGHARSIMEQALRKVIETESKPITL